jgi:hypothetical protein
MMEEIHQYHYFDNDGPRVSVKVEKNSKGFNYEAHVQGAKTPEEALNLLHTTIAALKTEYETV